MPNKSMASEGEQQRMSLRCRVAGAGSYLGSPNPQRKQMTYLVAGFPEYESLGGSRMWRAPC